jgi:hypothetical protein
MVLLILIVQVKKDVRKKPVPPKTQFLSLVEHNKVDFKQSFKFSAGYF